jgi:hypothetical protein
MVMLTTAGFARAYKLTSNACSSATLAGKGNWVGVAIVVLLAACSVTLLTGIPRNGDAMEQPRVITNASNKSHFRFLKTVFAGCLIVCLFFVSNFGIVIYEAKCHH